MSAGQYAYAEETTYKSETQVPKKKVRSNFIAKWLLNKIKQEAKQEENMNYGPQVLSKASGLSVDSPSIDQPDRAIQFTIYNANGGRVVETRRYDKRTDRNSNGLYIITSEQDFGKEIDKIITMESLKS